MSNRQHLSSSLFGRTAYKQETLVPVAGALTIDLRKGNSFFVTLDQNVTSITILADSPSGYVQRALITFEQDATGGWTVEGWPISVSWLGGVIPVINPDIAAKDRILIDTADGGASFYGFLVSSNNLSTRRLQELVDGEWSTNQMIYISGNETTELTPLTAFARTLLDDADQGTALATLGAEPADATILKGADIGNTVQGYDVDIPTVAASQAEMEAGTEEALRSVSPLRVKQAIDAFAGGGFIVQRQAVYHTARASTTNIFIRDDTTPKNDGGAEAFTVNITPTDIANKLLIRAVVYLSVNDDALPAIAALFQDNIVDALATGIVSTTRLTEGGLNAAHICYEMVAGTTAQITFKIRYGGAHSLGGSVTAYINTQTGTNYFNSTINSMIEVLEVTP